VIRVTARGAGATTFDDSAAVFTIAAGSPRIAVTSPNTAMGWAIGTPHVITWNHNLGGHTSVRVELTRNGGASWEVLAPTLPNTTASSGTFPWVVTGPATTTALVRVTSLDGPATDISNVAFSIVTPTITVRSPNTNVTWIIGSTHNVTWSHNLGLAESVRIELTADGGLTWRVVATDIANTTNKTGSFSWTVSGPVTTLARIRIAWVRDDTVQDLSDVPFRVR
jgi:hypothetical protein